MQNFLAHAEIDQVHWQRRSNFNTNAWQNFLSLLDGLFYIPTLFIKVIVKIPFRIEELLFNINFTDEDGGRQ